MLDCFHSLISQLEDELVEAFRDCLASSILDSIPDSASIFTYDTVDYISRQPVQGEGDSGESGDFHAARHTNVKLRHGDLQVNKFFLAEPLSQFYLTSPVPWVLDCFSRRTPTKANAPGGDRSSDLHVSSRARLHVATTADDLQVVNFYTYFDVSPVSDEEGSACPSSLATHSLQAEMGVDGKVPVTE